MIAHDLVAHRVEASANATTCNDMVLWRDLYFPDVQDGRCSDRVASQAHAPTTSRTCGVVVMLSPTR